SNGPSSVEVGPERHRAGSADHCDLRVLRADRVVDLAETVAEVGGDLILVPESEVTQVEWLRVTERYPIVAPAGLGPAVGELDQIQDVLDVGGHVVLGDGARTAVEVLAADPGGHDRHRRRAQLCTKLEILEVADGHRLVVSPRVAHLPALMAGADRRLPVVHVVESESVCDASA